MARVLAMRECFPVGNFKTIIKLIDSQSALCYHHAPAILNHVSDKILLTGRLLSTQIPMLPLSKGRLRPLNIEGAS